MADYLALCSEVVRDPDQIGGATVDGPSGEALHCVSLGDRSGWIALDRATAEELHGLLGRMLKWERGAVMDAAIAKLIADLTVWIVQAVLEATKGDPAPTSDELKARIRAELAAKAANPAWIDKLVDDALKNYLKP